MLCDAFGYFGRHGKNPTNDGSTPTSIARAVLFALYVVLHVVFCVACYVMCSSILADTVKHRTNDGSTHTSIIRVVLFVLYVALPLVFRVACYVFGYCARHGKTHTPMM